MWFKNVLRETDICLLLGGSVSQSGCQEAKKEVFASFLLMPGLQKAERERERE
jgi:hypothetical protein